MECGASFHSSSPIKIPSNSGTAKEDLSAIDVIDALGLPPAVTVDFLFQQNEVARIGTGLSYRLLPEA
jgi:hypothetical protein